MNSEMAKRILGLDEVRDLKELKRKYRLLIAEVHPDSGKMSSCKFSAQEINEAYGLLQKLYEEAKFSTFQPSNDSHENLHGNIHKEAEKAQNTRTMWDGPVNERAYAERDIYEQVSDEDGQVIGTISISFI